ncbi:RSPRY1 [Cordylochernes scorpioides]|uniref:RSPRY1 n=1 Tax=Cordylochernes scorpioides TaxID=51811 RepID=A0ABY6LT11_9ARAC|nr:RSPRY1 [Cordylochernes scorpioides]
MKVVKDIKIKEDSCTLCYDGIPNILLLPCQHIGKCRMIQQDSHVIHRKHDIGASLSRPPPLATVVRLCHRPEAAILWRRSIACI